MVSYEIEPFTDYGKHAKPGAFPHADSLLPVRPHLTIGPLLKILIHT